jgi:hypothetical protein
MASWSVTNAIRLIRWPQWVQTSGWTSYTLGSGGPSWGSSVCAAVARPRPAPRRGGFAGTPHAVGVLPIEQRAVLARIGDVVAHPRHPLERIHRLEVMPQQRIPPRAVEHGRLAV